MKNQPSKKPSRTFRCIHSLPFLLLPVAASALPLELGEVKGTFDTTLSVGGLYRLEDPDPTYYGTSNGGQQNSVNADDGNLNYKRGFASRVAKATHTLELKYRNFGALASGYYFYDAENQDDPRERTPLSNDARNRVGTYRDFLDLYVRGKFDVNGHALDLRFGRQVLNLGESTFIPNGINVVNSVDAAKLRVPGAELREVLLPVNMLKSSFSVSDNITAEAFWLLEFRRTEIDPAGTYFSTNDFATRGGTNVYLGFGALSDRTPLGAVPRDYDREPGNYNQFGADVHISVPALGNTDFGFYFVNYHSRLPVISARTPTGPVNVLQVQATASALASAQLAPAMIANGVPPATVATVLPQLLGLAFLGTPASSLPAGLAPYAPFYPGAVTIANGASQLGLLNAAATGRYFVEYPKNIRMLGVSFNTALGNTGIAMQGEVSYKRGVPLQIDDVELLFATLSALSSRFGQSNNANQVGNYLGQYDTEISGYRRKDVWTAQTTLTRTFGHFLGANQSTLIGEIGGIYVPSLPSKDELRFDGAGTFTSGSQVAMNNTTSAGSTPLPATPYSAFADPLSWGYQVVARLEYNNVFAGINITPAIAFVHDVKGNTPLPLGNFVSGRKSINLVAEFSWQNSWALEVRYVNFFGAGRYNLIADRDYVASTLKFSF
ncbi:MAG: DUF1302 domain-containing protein [Nibricoccus sp.]